MQSQITYIDSDTLRPAPDLSAGRVLVSSQALAWDGLYIEKGENDGFIPNDVTLTQHYFAMYVGPPLEWEWKDGSQFKTHCYRAGDLWVNPAGMPFSHRISGYNQFVLLTLDPDKIAELVPDRLLLQHQAFQRRHQAQDRHLQSMIQTLLVEAELGGPNGRLFADPWVRRSPPTSSTTTVLIVPILGRNSHRWIASGWGVWLTILKPTSPPTLLWRSWLYRRG